MDAYRFDRLAKRLSTPDTRRGLLRLVAGMPVAGALAALLGDGPDAGAQKDPERGSSHRRHRRKARHDPGKDKENRKGKRKGKKRRCAQAGQTPKTGKRAKRKHCCAGLVKDASGRCAASPPSSSSPTCLPPTNTSSTQGLQEAIDAAAVGTTLTLCAGTWALTETVVIAKDLTLVGVGAGQSILDGGRPASGPGGVRVLTIAAGATVTVQDLTITKGRAAPERFPDGVGGGIRNQGTLTLIGVSVSDNTAGYYAGGIDNHGGTLTLQANSHVTHNTARFEGGGINNLGGALTLEANSHVTHNTATFGGGINNQGGTVTLAGSHVADNTATFEGGGILLHSGTMTLQAGSSVTRNTAADTGGGISNRVGTVTLAAGSYVADNTAGSWGGGIINRGTVTLQAESHVTGNTSTIGAGGGIYNVRGTVTVDASALVCNNRPLGNQCVNVANCPAPSETCPD